MEITNKSKMLKGTTLHAQKKNLIIRLMRIGVSKNRYQKGFIHSISTLNFRNHIFIRLVQFLEKENFQKSLTEVNKKILKKFIINFSKNEASQKYLINILSTISSTFSALKSQNISVKMTPKDFEEIRDYLKNNYKKSDKFNRAILHKNIKNIKNQIVKRLVQILLETGLRIDELFQIKKEFIIKNNNGYFIDKHTIIGKGGFKILRKKLSKRSALFLLSMPCTNQHFIISKVTFNKYLKIYLGETAHALRYNFIQNLNQKLNKLEKSHNEKRKYMAPEVGHYRLQSVNQYSR